MLPAHNGAAALVPPTVIQPVEGQPELVTVQYVAYPVAGSASADTSGTSRFPFCTPEPVCHEGWVNVLLTPPPPPAPLGLRCVSFGFDHTDSLPYAPAFSCRLVPPTPVMYGSPAGESTPRLPSPQSYAPESPEAAKNAIP